MRKLCSILHPSTLCSIFTWLLPGEKVTPNLASSNYPCWGHYLNGKWVEKLLTAVPNNEWWMARKRVYVQMATLLWVCMAIMFVMESHLLLHLKHKILCSWFQSHHSYSDFIYHVIEIPTSYQNFEIQKLWKATLEFRNHFDEHHVLK